MKPHGYWKKWENVNAAISSRFPDLLAAGFCPTTEMLCASKMSTVLRNWGGVAGICCRLGVVPTRTFLTRDGHVARSFAELLFDEYLYSRGILHVPETRPFAGRQFRCDQQIGDLFVELWGGTASNNSKRIHAYAKNKESKQALYAQHETQKSRRYCESSLDRTNAFRRTDTSARTAATTLSTELNVRAVLTAGAVD